MIRRIPLLLVILASVAVGLAVGRPASACGGLFCSTGSGVPLPVDQNAERIIFEIHEDTITAHIQIQYVGESENFAWVVPIGSPTTTFDPPGSPSEELVDTEPSLFDPSLPAELPELPDMDFWRRYLAGHGPIHGLVDVAESSASTFNRLDILSSPIFFLPSQEFCDGTTGVSSVGGIGCMAASDEQTAARSASDGFANEAHDNSVTVFGHDFTDNYEFHVIGAERTEDLVTWLQGNGYNVSDNMTPVMDAYNGAGVVFLALKLRADRTAQDIVPIALTYAGRYPSIPIQLTAVAAQPLMGIQVYIVADRPYVPANYQMVRPDRNHILFDDQARINYFEWVARAADEADGRLFVAEYIGPDDTFTRTLSRFYTRVSPDQMTLDPVFAPSPNEGLAYGNTVDLTFRPAPIRCGELVPERLPSPCAYNYCGTGATCAVDASDQFGCVCPRGQTAQPLSAPDGTRHVTCVPDENPFGITPQAGGASTSFDPCASLDCGEGACLLRSGFATCACDDGAVAQLDRGGQPRCVRAGTRTQTFGPGGGVESRGASAAATPPPQGTEYAMAGGAPLRGLLVLLCLVALVAARRGARLPVVESESEN